MIKKELVDVTKFHNAFKIKVNQNPTVEIDNALIELRYRLMQEENSEYLEAAKNKDLIEVADALGDRAYLLLGDAVSTGIPLEKVFTEVHRSNMTKKGGLQSGEGKGVKSQGFEEPDLRFLLS